MKRVLREVATFKNAWSLWRSRLERRPLHHLVTRHPRLEFDAAPGAEAMATEVFHHRLYDIAETPVGMNDYVIDLGANHGFASCRFATLGARVLAFEPNPVVLEHLRHNVTANGLSSRVRIRPEAVTAISGKQVLEQSQSYGAGVSSMIPGFVEAAGGRVAAYREVASIRLDDAIAEEAWRGPIRLLKMDIEGSEEQVLGSISPELAARINSIAIEFHGDLSARDRLLAMLQGWAPDMVVREITHWKMLQAFRLSAAPA